MSINYVLYHNDVIFSCREEGPIYISVIREPIARYVSWYYFMRHGDSDMNNTQQLQNMLGRNAALPNEVITAHIEIYCLH